MEFILARFYLVPWSRILMPTSGWRVGGVCLLIYFCFSSTTFAQTKIWDKTYGGSMLDNLVAVQQTKDGGYILGGYSVSGKSGDKTQAGLGQSDYWIVKLNADGQKEWDKTFGGNGSDSLAAVLQTREGGYILGGYSDSEKSGDKSQASKGKSDYWIVKLNANGTKEWDRTIGGNDRDELASLQHTKDGGYIVGGGSASGKSGDKSHASKGLFDYWVLKLTANGSKVWDKTIGGDNHDKVEVIQQTREGGYVLGGSSSSGKSGDKSEPRTGGAYVAPDYWVVKITYNGTITWDKTFGTRSDDFLTALKQTSDDGYIVGGNFDSGYGVLKLKADGAKEWEKTFRTDYNLYLRSIIQTQEGDYLVGGIGYTSGGDKTEGSRGGSDYWLLRLAGDGSKIWDKTYGGAREDYLASVQQTPDGGFILGGSSASNRSGEKSEDNRGPANEDGYHQMDYWVVKIDNSGNGLGQIIDFPPISDITRTLGDAPFALLAQSSSGLPVSFQVISGSATLNGNVITLTGVGTVTVKATQAGNDKYLPAPEVTQTFLVEKERAIKKEWERAFVSTRSVFSLRVLRTSDGGYLLGGTSSYGITEDKSQPSRGLNDYWIIKVNAAGTKEWDKTFGGSRDDELTALQQTPDGGYILGGSSQSGKSGDKTEANKDSRGPDRYGYTTPDYWLVKVDANGNKEWDKTIGGDRGESLTSLQQTLIIQ